MGGEVEGGAAQMNGNQLERRHRKAAESRVCLYGTVGHPQNATHLSRSCCVKQRKVLKVASGSQTF